MLPVPEGRKGASSITSLGALERGGLLFFAPLKGPISRYLHAILIWLDGHFMAFKKKNIDF
jgi:hypothetical protein